jgi:serine/threonine protein kinase
MKSESEIGQEPEGTAPYASGSIPPSLEELAQQFPQLEILELLGQGGMGIVYKARQPRLDRLVALKVLPPEAGRDPAFAERFAREARALAKLSHPGIVTVYDFGESDGRFYLLMEFVDGVNLRHLLREGRLKPEEALQIVPQLCEALQYAHEQGVVHRDIKPENILLDKKGHVKIADFGLAKLLGPKAADSALTGSQQVMGTPHYMAPEQLERPLAVDHRADIYSLGVVFYELLTGELPLGRFAPPSHKVQVDVRLDEVVLRALAKEPERRYQHVSDVQEEVETIRASILGSADAPASQKHTACKKPGGHNRSTADVVQSALRAKRIRLSTGKVTSVSSVLAALFSVLFVVSLVFHVLPWELGLSGVVACLAIGSGAQMVAGLLGVS